MRRQKKKYRCRSDLFVHSLADNKESSFRCVSVQTTVIIVALQFLALQQLHATWLFAAPLRQESFARERRVWKKRLSHESYHQTSTKKIWPSLGHERSKSLSHRKKTQIASNRFKLQTESKECFFHGTSLRKHKLKIDAGRTRKSALTSCSRPQAP